MIHHIKLTGCLRKDYREEYFMIEVINIDEAAELTAYSKPYIQRILAEAGVTKFGNSGNYLKEEFIAFFKFRSIELSKPKIPGENNFIRNDRIFKKWRESYEADKRKE